MNNQSPEARTAWCAAMRAFVAVVESNSAVPVPTSVDVWAQLHEYTSELSQAQRVAAVHDFAELFGVPVKADRDGDRQTKIEIGEIRVYVHGYLDRTDKEHDREGSVITREQDAALMAEPDQVKGSAEDDDHVEHPLTGERSALPGECDAKTVNPQGETGRCCLAAGHDDPQNGRYIAQLAGAHFDPQFGLWDGETVRREAHVESDEGPGTCRHCGSTLLGMGYCLFPQAGDQALDERMQGVGAAAADGEWCASVAVDGDGVSFRCERPAGHDDRQHPDFDPDLERHYHPAYTGWVDSPHGAVLGR